MNPRFLRTIAFRALLAGAAAAPAALVASHAHASVAVAVQFEELVQRSKSVAVITPVEQRSVWEGRYIITYTKVHIEDGIAGDLATGNDVWIATRGGTVGNIGQSVDGEPVFFVGYSSVAFLREDVIDQDAKTPSGIFLVTSRAQGLFPISEDETTPLRAKKLRVSPAMGALYPPVAKVPMAQKALAREVLDGKSFAEARTTIAQTWQRLHPVTH